MRILYYNWVDYQDEQNRGGGVSIYQYNVIKSLARRDGINIAFLSSGTEYTLGKSGPFWRAVAGNGSGDYVRKFKIVNAGVLAPAHASFGDPAQISHPATEKVFFDFLQKNGPFDVIHFNNLEGLPAKILNLKERYPDTKVVLSLHNYFPFCSQVNFWSKMAENCHDYLDGRKCGVCISPAPVKRAEISERKVQNVLKKLGLTPGSRAFFEAQRRILRTGYLTERAALNSLGFAKASANYLRNRVLPNQASSGTASEPNPIPAAEPAAHFVRRRETYTKLINENCDAILGVSKRVCNIAERYGLSSKILQTSYIGVNGGAILGHGSGGIVLSRAA